jgi:hypothetical protein
MRDSSAAKRSQLGGWRVAIRPTFGMVDGWGWLGFWRFVVGL